MKHFGASLVVFWMISALQKYVRFLRGAELLGSKLAKYFKKLHYEATESRCATTNQRQTKAQVTGELIIMNWEPGAFGGLF